RAPPPGAAARPLRGNIPDGRAVGTADRTRTHRRQRRMARPRTRMPMAAIPARTATAHRGAAGPHRARRAAVILAAALLAPLALPALPAQPGATARLAAQSAEPPLQKRAAASRAKGAESAPVLVFEVADFQCPYCARFWRETFPRLDSAY